MEKNTSLFSDRSLTKNSFWSIGERIIERLVSFIISVVLARLLAPNDYGIVALIQIIINACSFLIEKGFGQALIQKKHPESIDYSSVLFFGVATSIILYIFLFKYSDNIATYFNSYNKDTVSKLIRVMGISLPLASINLVQKAYISKNMMFSKFFWATFVGTITSGGIGITIAYFGGGAWALIAQYLINLFMDTLILWVVVKIDIKPEISASRLKSLFSYGWKLVVSGLFGLGVDTIRSTLVAKKYTPSDLAHYNKGESLPKLVVGTFSVAVGNVMFPALSDAQDNLEELKLRVRKFMRMSSYIVFPCMTGMFAVSDILIPALFGSQWTLTVNYLKIFAAIYLFYPSLDAFFLSTKAIKKSGLVSIMEILSSVITLGILFALLKFGTIYLALGYLGSILLRVIIQSIIMTKTINYSFKEQVIDFIKNLIPSLVMGVSVYFIHYIPINKYLILTIQVLLGVGIYWVGSAIFKNKEYIFIKEMVSGLFRKRRKKDAY